MMAALALNVLTLHAMSITVEPQICATDAISYADQRPTVEKRLFRSDAVEQVIKQMQARLKNPKLAWMFSNCFPNTLDTTVHFRLDEDGMSYEELSAIVTRSAGLLKVRQAEPEGMLEIAR